MTSQSPFSPTHDAEASTSAVSVTALEVLEHEAHLSEANSLIKSYVIAAMGVGLVPIPLFDLVGLVGVQMKLVHGLAHHYDVPFSENLGKSLVTVLVGGALPIATTITASSFLKVIPGIGSLAGGTSVAVLSGAVTYAIGQVFAQHFASGGTLLDFDPASLRDRFQQELQDGETVAQGMQENPSDTHQP